MSADRWKNKNTPGCTHYLQPVTQQGNNSNNEPKTRSRR